MSSLSRCFNARVRLILSEETAKKWPERYHHTVHLPGQRAFAYDFALYYSEYSDPDPHAKVKLHGHYQPLLDPDDLFGLYLCEHKYRPTLCSKHTLPPNMFRFDLDYEELAPFKERTNSIPHKQKTIFPVAVVSMSYIEVRGLRTGYVIPGRDGRGAWAPKGCFKLPSRILEHYS